MVSTHASKTRPARPRAARAGALLVVLSLSSMAAVGAQPSLPPRTVSPAPLATLVSPDLTVDNGTVGLTIDQAITIALERNLSLVVQRYDTAQSRFRVLQDLGIYDVLTNLDLVASDEESPSATNLAGAAIQKFNRQSWNLSFDQLTPYGGTAGLRWNNTRQETNSTFATLNPSYSVDLDLTFAQPLLRNFGRAATNHDILVARTNLDVSRSEFERQVADVIQQVETAYWDLVEAKDQLEVAKEALDLAKELHERNKIRVDVGTLAPLELVQSEVGIATREEDIIRARAAVGDAEDRLRQLLNLDRGPLWSAEIAPATAPEMEPVQIDVEQAIDTALAERPELSSQRLQVQNLQLDANFFANQKLPQLGFSVTYGYNGLGGPITDRDFLTGEILSQSPGGYGDALDQITNLDFRGWTVAVNFGMPLQNRSARARDAIAVVALDQGRAQLESLRQQVVVEVRTAVRQVNTAAQQLESARVSRRLAEKNLDAERKRYENGMSTSFQVLQIQDDLTAARSRVVSATTGYRDALVGYYRAIGRLLEESGVTVEAGPNGTH